MRVVTKRTAVGLLSVAALGGVLALLRTAPQTEAEPRAPDRSLEWGVYQILWSTRQFADALAAKRAELAGAPDYVMFYRDLGRPFPRAACDVVRDGGAVPVISLELGSWHAPRARCLPRINRGQYDDRLAQWARAAGDYGDRVLLRFGFEFNGDWFSWSGDPAAYVEAWRRARGLFERAGARNVEWVWAPNMTSVPDTPDNAAHRYYPGDDCVDWVGIDGYNWGDRYDEWHTWQSCRALFEPLLREFATRYPDKAVMLAEFGSVEGTPGRKADWIRAAHHWLTQETRVSAVIWFDYDKRGEQEHDWRIASSSEALGAFNATFAAD